MPEIDYIDCKLTVTSDRKVKFQVGLSPGIVTDLCDDKLTKLTIARLNRFVGTNTGNCQQEDLRVLGLHLSHILFGGPVTGMPGYKVLVDVFDKLYTNFAEEFEIRKRNNGGKLPDYRLRVTLIFEEGMEEIAAYPWEFLYVLRPNKTGFFIAGESTGLILTRFVPSVIHSFQPAEKLHILIAWAQPKELRPIAGSSTVDAIEKLANGIENNLQMQNIKVISLAGATFESLKQTIEEKQPQIVHFIGHGRNEKGESEIALMKSQKEKDQETAEIVRLGLRREPEEVHWVKSESIRALFEAAPPRLVFLHACYSASAPGSLEIFKSTAQQVLRAGVPFVVAMQYEISNDDVTDFAKAFYDKLGEGLSIDEAVYAGRIELGRKEPSWSHPRFGTPVVYLQSADSVMVIKRVEPAFIVPDIAPGLHKCPNYDCTKMVSPDQIRCSCPKRLKLKQCPDCKKANMTEETECIWCGYSFAAQDPTLLQNSAILSAPAQDAMQAPRPDTAFAGSNLRKS